jgi:hypothetical protein
MNLFACLCEFSIAWINGALGVSINITHQDTFFSQGHTVEAKKSCEDPNPAFAAELPLFQTLGKSLSAHFATVTTIPLLLKSQFRQSLRCW